VRTIAFDPIEALERPRKQRHGRDGIGAV